MDKDLLNWAVQNSQSSFEKTAIDQEKLSFFQNALGPSDAVKMKEFIHFALGEDNPVDEKLTALDNLEMLVESIDNANDLESLGCWDNILKLLENSELVVSTLWIIGTAAQNNSRVKDLLIEKYKVLIKITEFLSSSNASVVQKSLYATSSLLCGNKHGIRKFKDLGGVELLVSLSKKDIFSNRVNFIFENVINIDDQINQSNQ